MQAYCRRFVTSQLSKQKSSSSWAINSLRTMSYGSRAAERLAHKTILITGASSGIGQATAIELANAAKGDIKLILAARRADRLENLKKELEETHSKIQVLCKSLDVTDIASIPQWVSSVPTEFADVDVLINNAGMVFGNEKVGEIHQSDIETMFNTNVLGLIALTQQYVPKFKAKNSGDIVMLGSIAGRDPYPGGAIYCATKAALHSFSEVIRKENIDNGIRVMEVQPGQVETEFSVVRMRGDKDKAKAIYKGVTPLEAIDIAEIIVFNLTRRANTVIAETLVFPNHQASARDVHRRAE